MTQMQYTPDSEIQNRIRAVQLKMADSGYDGLLVVHHTNLFYYSGTSQDAYLFIPESGKPLLMAKRSYERAKKESPIENIVRLTSLKQMTGLIQTHFGRSFTKIGLELDVIPYNTAAFYQNVLFKDIDLKDASALFRQMRMIKSDYEIGLLRHSAAVLDSAFAQVPGWLRLGMTEIELASLFEGHMRKNGYGGGCKVRAFNRDFMFGNLVSGTSGSEPSYFDGPVNGSGLTPANNPHGAGWKRIARDEPVYVDYTCVVNGYTADAERIYVLGELDDQLVQAHQTALTIQDELKLLIRPGVVWSTVWERSREIAKDAGLLNHYMGIGEERVRFVGHGVGLELDELPVFAGGFDQVLKTGMAFAIEPKFVFEQGAVGIENTFTVTEDGVEQLTKFSEEIQYV